MLNDIRQRLPRLRQALRTLVRESAAHAVPEYALLLAIIVAGGVIAYLVAGENAGNVFRVAAHHMQSGSRDMPDPTRLHDAGRSDAEVATNASETALRDRGWWSAHGTATLGVGAWIATMAGGVWLMKAMRRQPVQAAGPAVELPAVPPYEPTTYDRLVEKRQQICRIITRNAENTTSDHTLVRHLMSPHLATVPAQASVEQAREIMCDKGIRHLLVCRDNGTLLGIVSDRDIVHRPGVTVSEIMTPQPVVVSPDMAVGTAITLMLSRSISCLPVMEHDELCGVLTTTDVMLSSQCLLQVVERSACGLCLKKAPKQTTTISGPEQRERPAATAVQSNC